MHRTSNEQPRVSTAPAIEAATRELIRWGNENGYFNDIGYEELNPISRDEFEAIAERMLKAALAILPETDSTQPEN